MYYIALKMLFGDKAKYYALIAGISFAALIMTQQPSIFLGLLTRTYSFISDVSEPDIWAMDPGVKFAEEGKPMRDIELLKIRSIDGVKWAAPMLKMLIRGKMPDGSQSTVDITGIDDASLIGAPYKILEGNLEQFRQQNAIFVDKNAAETKLRVQIDKEHSRPLRVGDVLELNDRRAVVVGIFKATRNFVLQPQIYTSYSNALKFVPGGRKNLGYVLVKAKEDMDQEILKANIERVTGLTALTKEEFKKANLDYWMKSTGIAINFGVSVLLGFVVGAAIAGQTFYGFVLENLKYYAVLKAMWVTNSKLTRIVLLQASVVGFIVYGLGVGITAIFGLNFLDSILAFRMAPEILLFAGCGVLLIISLAAIVGIRKVISVDPSSVFRG